ncbi:MAG: efflux RND transporter periplasmic adaptor subunit [Hyphomicrobiales bacterium]|nr:efflux RND transporter periplasmic adaptor subunit [Hyphomicrobiales bacterium]
MRKSVCVFVILALVATAIVGAAYFVRSRPLALKVAQVEESVPIRVFGLGTVEARVVSKASFDVGAMIVEFAADHGNHVKKGDELARLVSTEQEAKVARAKAASRSAEAATLKAQTNVEKARAVLAQRREANRRKQALVGRSVVSEQTAEEAQRDEDVAKADLAVAESDVEVAKAQLADASAQYDYERTILSRHVLVAPFDAVVVDRLRELGTVIKAGDPVFTLMENGSGWVLASVDESRAGPIAFGQRAQVRLRSRPRETFEARVVRIGIESDRVSEERRVYVKCDRCPESFHLGEQAEALIDITKLPSALMIPETAVQGFDGRRGAVWTIANGRLERRRVDFGLRTDDAHLEYAGGLAEGAQIVVEPVPEGSEGRAAEPL